MFQKDMDIAKNIKMIDNLQCQLLALVSELFSSMQDSSIGTKERGEILANMEIILYLLGERLGISYAALDQRVLGRLKLGMLDTASNESWQESFLGLFKHLDGRGEK